MSPQDTPQDVIDFFMDPTSYAHPVERVEHQRTHISHLFFAGDYVYKVKKPLDLGFLDFSSLEKRRAAGLSEIELNRRIAPDIYLDLVAVHRDAQGRLSFFAPTRVQEVTVVMRRLPAERSLSRLTETGQARPEMMKSLSRLIAHFHKRAATSDEISRYGSFEVVKANWDENFEQTEPFIGRTIPREGWESCKREIERYMRAFADLFAERIAGGWIRDCHGDLQAADIFIDAATGASHVLDCIEFDVRYRYSDTLADIAFLSMDLKHRGARDLADAFLDAYYESSDDEPLTSLLRFYECYRAYVRGKVRSLMIDQMEPSYEEKEAAASEARRFFSLAVAKSLCLRPRLILVAGLMGSGKTTLADALGERGGVRVIHSDVTRKRLAGLAPETARIVPFGKDIYSSEWTERTYQALLDEARRELARGNSLILDATWAKAKQRAAARAAAAEREAMFAIVECTAPENILQQRLAGERVVTDGRLEIFEAQRAAFESVDASEAERTLEIETTDAAEDLSARVHAELFLTESPQPRDS